MNLVQMPTENRTLAGRLDVRSEERNQDDI